MSIDSTYLKSAIQTLILIQHLFNYLKKTQTTNKLEDNFSQIEAKADARASLSLGQQLGIIIPVADQEEKSQKYWEGIRDMARLTKKQWLTLQDNHKLSEFLKNAKTLLSVKIAYEEEPTAR